MSYIPASKTNSLTPYDPIEGQYRVRMDANESFLLPTEEDRLKMVSAAADVALNRYPDPLAVKLCSDFASLYEISPAYVTAGNGSDELISIIMSSFLQKGDKVLTLSPDFSMYRFYTSITETPCVTLEKNEDLTIHVDLLLKTAQKQKVSLIIFSNPCNPTSLGLKAEDVRKIINGTDALVVLDEAYMDFWDQTLIQEAHEYDNLILLRTSSKALGMAALRLGFAIANPRLTGILRAAKSPYNVNAVTQAMAGVVLQNNMYKTVYHDILLTSRDMLIDGLRRLERNGLIDKVYESRTNFAYIKLSDARGVFDWLADRGVIVRRFGEHHLRITAGKQEENLEVISAMEVFLKRMKGGKST